MCQLKENVTNFSNFLKQSQTKKKEQRRRSEVRRTGGGGSVEALKPWEEKVYMIIIKIVYKT